MIASKLINYKNSRGKNIIGFYDYIEGDSIDRPFVIIPSVYGETKANSISLSYFLVRNGFRVIRYDNTDHIGESGGEVLNFTLPKAKEDLISTLDFAQEKFGIKEFGVIARCLAFRWALRAAVEDKRIKFLLSLVGIVDLQSTLASVYHDDIIGIFLEAQKKQQDLNSVFLRNKEGRNCIDILGFEVSREFPISAIQEEYHDLKTTQTDMQKINIPFIYLFAENDSWVKLEDVKKALFMGINIDRELFIIPEAVHMLYENPLATKVALKQIVVSCTKYLLGKRLSLEKVIEPEVRWVARQNRIEKEKLKAHELIKEQEKQFWSEYLTKYILIDKSQDYREYLEALFNTFDGACEGEMVLDAGCGNGHYGAWLLKRIFKDYETSTSYTYVGIDFVENALREASKQHKEIKANILTKTKAIFKDPVNIFYVMGDLDPNSKFYICFKDNCFDKICCSFLIPFVKNPLRVLKELFRILKPKGRIAVSSLKPYADLSEIYRRFAEQTDNEEEIEEARRLLSSAGKIKVKESEGYYRFYDDNGLKVLLKSAGGENIYLYRTFANQAIIAVSEKPR